MPISRLAMNNDIDAVYAIESAAGFNQWSQQQIQDSFKNHSVFVIEQQSLIVGYAVFQQVLDEVELLNIVILPAMQGKQLGFLLLHFCLGYYIQHHVVRCLLEVGKTNQSAIRLYEKLNFKPIAIRKNYYQRNHITEDALIMERILGV